MADNNAVNITGTYSGALSATGPVFLGTGNTYEGTDPRPVLAVGEGNSLAAAAVHSFVAGRNARATADHSFVFNGVNSSVAFTDGGRAGTFSVNPENGLGGMFVGSLSMLTHMDALTSYVNDRLTDSSLSNNLLHRDGDETASGIKTFQSSVVVGSSAENVTLCGSSVCINTAADGRLLFKRGATTTSVGAESDGTIRAYNKFKVDDNATFNGSSNSFKNITLQNGQTASFTSGNAYVATASLGSNSSLAASTEYVDKMLDNITTGLVTGADATYTGNNTFTGSTTLSGASLKGKVVYSNAVSFAAGGSLFVADATGDNSSSLAANTKFVRSVASSLRASLGMVYGTSVGSSLKPVYFNGDKITAFSSNLGNDSKFLYLSGGTMTETTLSNGNPTTPLYMSNGQLLACNTFVDVGSDQSSISGNKTFTGSLVVSGRAIVSSSLLLGGGKDAVCVQNAAITKGASPANDQYVGMTMMGAGAYGADSAAVGHLRSVQKSDGSMQTYIDVVKNVRNSTDTASLGLGYDISGNATAWSPQPPSSSSLFGDAYIATTGWTSSLFVRRESPTTVINGSLEVAGKLKTSQSLVVTSDAEVDGTTTTRSLIVNNTGSNDFASIRGSLRANDMTSAGGYLHLRNPDVVKGVGDAFTESALSFESREGEGSDKSKVRLGHMLWRRGSGGISEIEMAALPYRKDGVLSPAASLVLTTNPTATECTVKCSPPPSNSSLATDTYVATTGWASSLFVRKDDPTFNGGSLRVNYVQVGSDSSNTGLAIVNGSLKLASYGNFTAPDRALSDFKWEARNESPIIVKRGGGSTGYLHVMSMGDETRTWDFSVDHTTRYGGALAIRNYRHTTSSGSSLSGEYIFPVDRMVNFRQVPYCFSFNFTGKRKFFVYNMMSGIYGWNFASSRRFDIYINNISTSTSSLTASLGLYDELGGLWSVEQGQCLSFKGLKVSSTSSSSEQSYEYFNASLNNAGLSLTLMFY